MGEPASRSILGFSGLVGADLVSIVVLAVCSPGLLVFVVVERWGVSMAGAGTWLDSAEVSAS